MRAGAGLARRSGLVGASLAAIVGAGACLPPEATVPLDRPVYPTGLALANDHLIVVSSDFDLAFDEGAVLAADLGKVREAASSSEDEFVVEKAYAGAVVMPPFGDRPAVTSGGERAYVPTRGSNIVAVVDIGADGAVTCGDAENCGASPFALQLSKSDPFDVLILDEQRDGADLTRVTGLVTFISSNEAVFFTDDPRRSGAERVQIGRTIQLGANLAGVRSAVVRPATNGSGELVLAAADLDPDVGPAGAVLLAFDPNVADPDFARVDVSAQTGAFSMRDVLLVPGDDGENDALIAVLRGPDGLARFEIDDDGRLPALRLSEVASTCRSPTSLALAHLPTADGDVDRVILTCQDSDTVELLDPYSLEPTDAIRFEGRAPYDVVVDTSDATPRAYVSFFLDDSIGVLDLEKDGAPGAVFRGRIGRQSAAPEDGRE